MKLNRLAVCAMSAFALAAGAGGANATNLVYYSSYTDTGSSITFNGSPYLSGSAPALAFGDLQPSAAINAAANWPGASVLFAADLTGTVYIGTAGTYNLSLESDDASYLFIDGSLIISNGGAHSEATVSGTDFLTAGSHSVEVQYDNDYCCGSGVALTGDLPAGGVPEPSTWAMMLLGLAGVGTAMRVYRRSGRDLDASSTI